MRPLLRTSTKKLGACVLVFLAACGARAPQAPTLGSDWRRPGPEQTLWVFGYGSLLNQNSRMRSGGAADIVYVTVPGLARSWNACAPAPFEFVAVGTERREGAETSGAVFQVDPAQLGAMDAREKGYDPVPIDVSRIAPRPAAIEADDIVFGYAKPAVSLEQQLAGCPQAPIPESYVDVILVGLLAEQPGPKGEVLAEEFLRTTSGWERLRFVDDRAAPRAMAPLLDPSRGTRGCVLPELTPELEKRIDRLLARVQVSGKSLLEWRVPDLAGGWTCDSAKAATADRPCPSKCEVQTFGGPAP